MNFARIFKDWILVFSMAAGVLGYFAYVNIPFLEPTHDVVREAVEIVQPLLIFVMLFLTFCRVNPRRLRLCGWHLRLLLVQCGLFALFAALTVALPRGGLRVVLEGAMLCFVCPTATASAVVTRKLGGSAAHITTYVILVNLAVALLVPAVVPLVHPNPDLSMGSSFLLILGKVFPLLLLPLVAAILVRYLSPKLHFALSHYPNLSFYLWTVALALAIAMTTRSIVHSRLELSAELGLVGVSLASCLAQFWLGRRIGRRYDDAVTAGQAFGQKNTVLAIWMGYTFFTPATAVVGGFYCVWHNIVNAWQIYRYNRRREGE